MLRKSMMFGVVTILAVALFVAITARNAASTVAGGKHDLSFNGSANYSFLNDEPCIYCHTPHGANRSQRYSTDPNTNVGGGTLNGQFLWNRALPSQAFSVYSSTTMNATAGQPGTLSLLCLSCHDGIGALNVLINFRPAATQPQPFGGFTENQFGDFNLADPNMGRLNIGDAVCVGDSCVGVDNGTNLQNDHPIGFSYDTAQAADAGLKAFASLPAILQKRLNLVSASHNLECSTCHDPHLTNNPGGNNFLVMSNAASALCLGCHNK